MRYGKLLVLALLAACTAGCTSLTPKAAPKVAQAVGLYCLEPFEVRLLLRAQVNEMTKPNSVKVTCVGDPE